MTNYLSEHLVLYKVAEQCQYELVFVLSTAVIHLDVQNRWHVTLFLGNVFKALHEHCSCQVRVLRKLTITHVNICSMAVCQCTHNMHFQLLLVACGLKRNLYR